MNADVISVEPAVSKLHKFCGGVIEACWLGAVAVIPLLWDPNTYLSFDPAKQMFLRILALVTVAACLVREIEEGHPLVRGFHRIRSLVRNPVVLALATLVLAYAVATSFSVNPMASLWGTLSRLQGTYSYFSGLVLLGSVAAYLRTQVQIERLVTTLITASLPVALYAIVQRTDFNPLGPNPTGSRSFSTLGQPIFLAGYLLMVLPVTLWRMVQASRIGGNGSKNANTRIVSISFYAGAALLQLTAFFCAESRGPLLALGTTLAYLGVGMAVHRRRYSLLLATGAAVVAAFGLLLLISLPNGPFTRWSTFPGLTRFSHALPLRDGPDAFRTEVWKRAPRMMLAREPLPYPTGGIDRFDRLRPFVGYGPETLDNVLPRSLYWPGPQVAAPFFVERFHNVVWDMWFDVGWLGLTAFLAFVILLFFHGYRRLGIIHSPPSRWAFVGLVVGGVAAGSVGFWLWGGPGFAGLGGILGLVAGFAAHPPLAAHWLGTPSPANPLEDSRATLLIALLAALAGHLVDMAFAFPTAATFTLFSVYIGLILVLIYRGESMPHGLARQAAGEERTPAPHGHRQKKTPTRSAPPAIEFQPTCECAIQSTLILVTFILAFVHLYFHQPLSPGSVLWTALTRIAGGDQPSYLLVLVLFPAWVGVNFAFAMEAAIRGKSISLIRLWVTSSALSGLAVLALAALKAWQISEIGPLPGWGATAVAVLDQCAGYETMCLTSTALLTGLVLLSGVLILRPSTAPFGRLGGGWIALASLAAVLAVASSTVIVPQRANSAAGWAVALGMFGKAQDGVTACRRAVSLNSSSAELHRTFAAMLEKVASESPGDQYDRLMTEAEVEFTAVQTLTRGLYFSNYELGRLYLRWAGRKSQPEEKLAFAHRASRFFEQALVFQPDSPITWVDSATTDLIYLNQPAEALRKTLRAKELTRHQTALAWADRYRDLSYGIRDPNMMRQYALRASEFYETVNAAPHLDPAFAARSRLSQGEMLMILNELDRALVVLLESLKASPDEAEVSWKAETFIAQIYFQQGNRSAAREHVSSALERAPKDKAANLLLFQKQIGP